jgi:cation transport ATPase
VRNVQSVSTIKTIFLSDLERSLFIIGVLLVPGVIVIPNIKIMAFTYCCCQRSQYMMCLGLIITSICRYDKRFWPTVLLPISLLLLFIGLMGGAFSTNLYENKPVSRITSFFWHNSFFILMASASIFFAVLFYQVFSIFKNLHYYIKAKSESTESSKKDYLFVLAYCGIIITSFIFLVVTSFAKLGNTEDLVHLNEVDLILSSSPFVLFLLLLSVLLMRIAKSEMTDAVLALIDSKKVYVRYISHELRTPLNAILLGIF